MGLPEASPSERMTGMQLHEGARIRQISDGQATLLFECEEDSTIDVTIVNSRMESDPARPHGQPSDIASIAVFLASQDSAWLTGERILASGGFR